MPNHFHGILFIHENAGVTRQGQTRLRSDAKPWQTITTEGMDGSPLPRGPKPASLGTILAQFKSRATKRIWKIPEFKETPIWQRNYYEHVIRNERELNQMREYITSNVIRWMEDEENPENVKEIQLLTGFTPHSHTSSR